jgi:uncharacterized membrane protein YeiB
MRNVNSVISKVTLQHGVAPVALGERIAVLDVIRGFALIGIFLMNIEFFNRPVGELGEGMPSNLEVFDWLASYLIAYFVAGKFWTIFVVSLCVSMCISNNQSTSMENWHAAVWFLVHDDDFWDGSRVSSSQKIGKRF